MTPREVADELARMAERYKLEESRRRVRMVAEPQNAGNAQAIPEMPVAEPDIDEYAYRGSPSPPVRGEPKMPASWVPDPAPLPYSPPMGSAASTGGPTDVFQPAARNYAATARDLAKGYVSDFDNYVKAGRGSLRRGIEKTGFYEAFPKLVGPHLGAATDKLGTAAELLIPGGGTMQDAAEAGRQLELGNYGRAAGATALGAGSAALDFIPGGAAVKGVLKGLATGTRHINDILPAAGAAGAILPKVRRGKAAAVEAPAVVRDEATAATEKILEQAARERRPTYPPATEPVFKTRDETGELTRELVPQTSIRDQIPRPDPGTNQLPLNDRARMVAENVEPISDIIARDLAPRVQANTPSGQFYHTGPVILGLNDIGGLSPAESLHHLGQWSGQGAATSPRTATPQNLRNASYLLWRQEQGDPLTKAKLLKEGNLPGFGMMGMHAQLGDEFARGVVNINKNPKPSIFQRNWAGNLADVTGDTHNIRGTLAALDELYPGKLPREWFVSDDAYKAYQKRGGFGKDPLPVGDIKDTLEGATQKKAFKQSEYGIMTDPWYRAAEKLGVPPATGQAHGWFGYGDRTGLMSPELTIPDLLNSQIEATARATGLHPEKILQFWGRRRIPLAEAPGSASGSQVG